MKTKIFILLLTLPLISFSQIKNYKITYKETDAKRTKKNSLKDADLGSIRLLTPFKDSVTNPKAIYYTTVEGNNKMATYYIPKQKVIVLEPGRRFSRPECTVFKNFVTGKTIQEKKFPRNIIPRVLKRDINFYKWEISNETKKISNLICKKAIGTNKYNEKVTCWYNDSLGIIAAPGHFDGLPGLIVHLYDPKIKRTYQITKIEYPKSLKLRKLSAKHKIITEEEFRNPKPIVQIIHH